ncbi:MAG: MmgE/PrpD family protein [Chloroflexi bacterium]|nr:MmgE/PrpD family protein [Chloroflexota bacterium]
MASEAPTVTSEVVQFILRQGSAPLPPEVAAEARRCVLDGTAVMLAGSTEPCSHILRAHLKEIGAPGPSSVLGSDLRAPAHLAALANGVSGHAMDYDDTQLASSPDRVYGLLTHPTVPVLAASLALGQELGTSGRDVLRAYAIGFEVECKLCEAINPRHYQGGFHSTATFGPLGATTAASVLLGLDERQARMALGIAASKAAGIRANFGTMTKPYHAGAAAESGIVAARLARLGYTADPNALDGQWGFFQVLGGGCNPSFIRGKLGNPWSVVEPGVSVKPYPCGSLLHPAMDTLLDMLTENQVLSGQIAEVRLGTTSNVLAALRYREPQNALEAKFSIPFMLGILALRRRAGIAEFKDEVVRSPEVRSMMAKVHPYQDAELEARGFERIRARVQVRLADGHALERIAEVSRGTPQKPMTRQELGQKFADCAQGVLAADRIPQAIAAVERLEEFGDVGEFVRTLT